MPDILVRGVSQEAVDALKKKAKSNGVSLNAILKEVVSSAANASQAKAGWATLRRFQDSAKGNWNGPTIVDMLREDRDKP